MGGRHCRSFEPFRPVRLPPIVSSSQGGRVKAEQSASFTLWRVRGVRHGEARELRCTMEQLGEGCFELRVQCGRA